MEWRYRRISTIGKHRELDWAIVTLWAFEEWRIMPYNRLQCNENARTSNACLTKHFSIWLFSYVERLKTLENMTCVHNKVLEKEILNFIFSRFACSLSQTSAIKHERSKVQKHRWYNLREHLFGRSDKAQKTTHAFERIVFDQPNGMP